jgi:hypothetical protein
MAPLFHANHFGTSSSSSSEIVWRSVLRNNALRAKETSGRSSWATRVSHLLCLDLKKMGRISGRVPQQHGTRGTEAAFSATRYCSCHNRSVLSHEPERMVLSSTRATQLTPLM